MEALDEFKKAMESQSGRTDAEYKRAIRVGARFLNRYELFEPLRWSIWSVENDGGCDRGGYKAAKFAWGPVNGDWRKKGEIATILRHWAKILGGKDGVVAIKLSTDAILGLRDEDIPVIIAGASLSNVGDLAATLTAFNKLERPKRLVDLGWANGWGRRTPDLVKECRKLQHCTLHTPAGNCVTKITCSGCGYFYMIDSGD